MKDYVEVDVPEETPSAPPVVEGAFRGNLSSADDNKQSGDSAAVLNKCSHFLIILASFLTFLI